MHPIWVIQLSVDIFLLALTCWWIWDRRQQSEVKAMETHLRATLAVLEERVEKQDQEWHLLQGRIHNQVAHLEKICTEATRILERSQLHLGGPTPTQEEKELLAAMEGSIPKMDEVDRTRKRLKRERLFDLAQVLNDQIS